MYSNRIKAMLYAILLGAALDITIHSANAQDLNAVVRPRTVTKAVSVNMVAEGQKLHITGNVIRAQGDSFSVCDSAGAETVVVVSPSTKISTHRRGVFRGAETLDKASLLVGLRVQVKGRGNDAGQLSASWIRFHDADSRAESEVETRAYPLEIEQSRQGKQLEQTDSVANDALKDAKTANDSAGRAQQTADSATSSAQTANATATSAQAAALAAQTRIAAIDDFDETGSLMVNFKAGSAVLSGEAKSKLDEFAAKTSSAKGYVVELSGFTSNEGTAHYNHELSARRAEAVMDYLIGKGNVPLRRIIPPYSGGETNPIADNKTREGREQNRRVEVKMLVSKGLAGTQAVAVSSK